MWEGYGENSEENGGTFYGGDNNRNFVSERLCAKFVRLGQDTSSTRF